MKTLFYFFALSILISAPMQAEISPGIANLALQGTLMVKDKNGNSLGNVGISSRLVINANSFPITFQIEKDCNQTVYTIKESGCYSIDYAWGQSANPNVCINYTALTIDNWGCFWTFIPKEKQGR